MFIFLATRTLLVVWPRQPPRDRVRQDTNLLRCPMPYSGVSSFWTLDWWCPGTALIFFTAAAGGATESLPSLHKAVGSTPALPFLGVVVHTCDPSTREVPEFPFGAGEMAPWVKCTFLCQHDNLTSEPRYPGKNLCRVVATSSCNTAVVGGWKRGSLEPAGPLA